MGSRAPGLQPGSSGRLLIALTSRTAFMVTATALVSPLDKEAARGPPPLPELLQGPYCSCTACWVVPHGFLAPASESRQPPPGIVCPRLPP